MTDSDIVDEEKIGTALAQRALDRLLSAIAKKANKWTAQYKNATLKSFAKYLILRQRHVRQIRNFIYDIESVPLEKIYVPTHLLDTDRKRISDSDLLGLISATPGLEKKFSTERPTLATIIRGVGGSGKSMFLRWLFLQSCRREESRIPIFIELRDFNDGPRQSIIELIQSEFEAYDSNISEEQILLGLHAGLFILFFDGLDEINQEYEPHYYKTINDCAKKYAQCPLIVSGRPMMEMLSWSDFKIFDIAGLRRSETEALVNNLRFDEVAKINFISACRKKLFQSHGSFLEIPLLVIVMMLTFSDNGRISNESHEFYEDAFNALWNKHDARKESFQRRRYSNLGKQRFVDLLSAFSASAYVRATFSFRDADLERHLANAIQLTGIKVDPDDFFKDLTKSTSLCVRDGSFLRFSHRTFQEYFCALYVIKQDGSAAEMAIKEVAHRWETDSVIPLIKSINPERFERSFTLPVLSNAIPRLKKCANRKTYISILDESLGHMLGCIRKVYNLKPTADDIRAALDALVQMGPKGQDKIHDVMARDVKNFISLHDKLSARLRGLDRTKDAIFGSA